MRKQLFVVAGIVVLTVGLAAGYQWYTEGKWFVSEPEKDFQLSKLIAEIRMATQRYQDVEQAEADGYVQISGNVPLEGYHFYKAGIVQFDYGRPSALLYIRADEQWQLVGLEYAVPKDRPAESPFPGVAWERHLRNAATRTGKSFWPAPLRHAPGHILIPKVPSSHGTPTCG